MPILHLLYQFSLSGISILEKQLRKRIFNFIPMRLVKLVVPLLSKGSTASTRVMSRRRPLYTCGASILAIAFCICTKAQEFHGPLGSITNKFFNFITAAFPFMYTMQCQWLAMLSFADDYILNAETMVEAIFPPTTRVFDKIDELVHTAEGLPAKVDGVFNTFPTYLHQFPFLDWALVHLISLLNFFISTLTQWGSNNTREKEIMVDVNCNNNNSEIESTEQAAQCHRECTIDSQTEYVKPSSKSDFQAQERVIHGEAQHHDHQCKTAEKPCPVSVSVQDETNNAIDIAECPPETPLYSQYEDASSSPFAADSSHNWNESSLDNMDVKPDVSKCSYKEMLEKGAKEDTSMVMSTKTTISEQHKNGIEGTTLEDPVLEFFESSWHMNKSKKKK